MNHYRHPHVIEHHKPSSTLHVIAVISNPVRFKRRYELFKNFQAYMLTQNVNLICVELAFGDRDFVCTQKDNPNHVQVRGKTELWHKENLINLGFQRLPTDWQYAAWIDADVEFLNTNWVHDTLNALQHHKIVQVFKDCIDLGPSGGVIQTHRSFGYQYVNGAPMETTLDYDVKFPHPGYAWAIRREAYDGIGGLVDFAILGAADHHMAWAFIGNVARSVPKVGMAPNYLGKLKVFETRSETHIKRDIGYVPGTIQHFWHGKKADRKYIERWSVLIKNKYDPETDIKKNHFGVIELEEYKLGLRNDIRTYMRNRNEDSVDEE